MKRGSIAINDDGVPPGTIAINVDTTNFMERYRPKSREFIADVITSAKTSAASESSVPLPVPDLALVAPKKTQASPKPSPVAFVVDRSTLEVEKATCADENAKLVDR